MSPKETWSGAGRIWRPVERDEHAEPPNPVSGRSGSARLPRSRCLGSWSTVRPRRFRDGVPAFGTGLRPDREAHEAVREIR